MLNYFGVGAVDTLQLLKNNASAQGNQNAKKKNNGSAEGIYTESTRIYTESTRIYTKSTRIYTKY